MGGYVSSLFLAILSRFKTLSPLLFWVYSYFNIIAASYTSAALATFHFRMTPAARKEMQGAEA